MAWCSFFYKYLRYFSQINSSKGVKIVKQLQAEITAFLKERDWLDQYNHPKDLAISLSLEAAELLECFQWKTDEIALKENREELLKEVADVLIYALQIAESMGADGEELVRMKLAENRRRTWPKK
ncbi:putative pyrophosphatase [Listeria monocytogenes]|nr:putative pyrophosphatase [Listeria monocytogenes]GAM96156.1 putative pyrophosphatase [Listeria monocytogenes]